MSILAAALPSSGSFTVRCYDATGKITGYVGGSTIHGSWKAAVAYYTRKTRSQIKRGLVKNVASAVLELDGTTHTATLAL